MQACAARNGCMSGSVDEVETGFWSIAAGGAWKRQAGGATDGAAPEDCRHPTAATNSSLSPRLTVASNAVHLLHLVGRENA